MELSFFSYVLIFFVVYFSQTYGSIVGGGSFLNQPLLISLGVPPQVTVATEIASTTGTAAGGFYVFHKKKMIRWELLKYAFPGLLLGTALGVFFLSSVSSDFIENFVGVVSIFGVIYILLSKKKDIGVSGFRLPSYAPFWLFLFGLLIGAYISFSGAGTALIANIILTTFFGATFLEAMGMRKPLFIIPMVLSGLSYAYLGLIDFTLWCVMFPACLLGGITGSKVAIYLGDKWIKVIFSVMVFALSGWIIFT